MPKPGAHDEVVEDFYGLKLSPAWKEFLHETRVGSNFKPHETNGQNLKSKRKDKTPKVFKQLAMPGKGKT